MKRVLVTGGAGYIGSHVVKALGEQGYSVVVYDNLSKGHREAVLYGDFVEGDLGNRQLVDHVMDEYHPDAVMHFAAFIEVGESVREPLTYYRNNLANTINLLCAMERAGIGNLIFSSTAAVYGNPKTTPITEAQPIQPINPYGYAKAFVENILADQAATGRIRYVALRYFNAAGADPGGLIGERHNPESHLIPLILATAKGIRDNIAIFGNDYPTPDGTCIRDYIHVNDLADAHLLALKHLMNNGKSAIFNCGYGKGYSVREVIHAVQNVTGTKVPIVTAGRRQGDPPILVADSSKIRRELGWRPHFDSIEQIISTAWHWASKSSRI